MSQKSALEENGETEQDDSAADSDDSTQFPPIVSSITIDEAKQMLLDVCKFAASIGCSEAQDNTTSALHFLNKYVFQQVHKHTANARQLTLHDSFEK